MTDSKTPITQTRTYFTWHRMKSRCTKPFHQDYYLYGARGISVCDRWMASYENFYNNMGEKPKGFSIDRIDNNGNYEPNNCRWASPHQQSLNKRSSRLIVLGEVTKNLSTWAQENNITPHVLRYRIQARMPEENLFSKDKVKPKDYSHLKNLSRKDNVILEFNNQFLTISQWSEKTGLKHTTIWHRIYTSKMSIEEALTKSTGRPWNHGTNTGYSTYKCRCLECTEFNRHKSQRARDRLKLKRGVQ